MQSRKRDTSWKLSYLVAICLRLTIVLTSTSFIHPDEHFQNTEIAIADVFNRSNRQTRTWEWDPLRISDRTIGGGPVRSIVPVWMTSHLGLHVLKLLHNIGMIVSTASLISGTLLLSIQPHQEARFLLPLVFPLTTLCSQSISKSRSSKFRRTFWFAHLMHSAITVVLFGYLHQGGLQSALEVLPPNTETLLSYKTFDIPSSLITSTQLRNVTNLRGATEETLAKTLCEIVSMDEERRIVLLAPRWALSPSLEHRFKLLFSSAIPHLDLDRLDEIFHAGRHRSGIGLYSIHQQNMKASELCH
ncbi:alpha 1,2 mannosyltransferase [Puccinia graminis f. sp. tritici]|uniref:Mannosyltransferase n=1 Tax=Puccinia graminis f. sp. tritici TaxID=56615 RepID=A0A5B0P852_PUCGR|nr:alpha 1,2 mannosyltransferase [Puccinia graminis f. sp. tritici]